MTVPEISDHALLRWMERVHGVDVETWRELMREELRGAMDAYDGQRPSHGEAFVLNSAGDRVVTFIGAKQALSPYQKNTPVLTRVV